MIVSIKNLKNKYNLQVQYLHYSSARGNVAFERACKQKGLEVDFKYTAPSMPQQNGCIEQKFTFLFNCVCTMLNGSTFNAYLQNGQWAKAANTNMLFANHSQQKLKPISTIFGKGKRSILSLMQNLVKCVPPPTGITHTRLNQSIQALQVHGLATWKVIPPVHISFSTPKQKGLI